jgi:hypothetical protein
MGIGFGGRWGGFRGGGAGALGEGYRGLRTVSELSLFVSSSGEPLLNHLDGQVPDFLVSIGRQGLDQIIIPSGVNPDQNV